MQLSCVAVALAALSLQGALAQPAHQRHHHKHKRGHENVIEARDVNFNNAELYKDVDWTSVFSYLSATANQAATPVATPAASPLETFTPAVLTPTPTPAAEPISASTQTDAPPKEEEVTGQKHGHHQHYPDHAPSKSFGGQTAPVDDGNKDHYIGNVGNPYGSNMIIVDESQRSNYKYTLSLRNVHDAPTTYIIWNKSGRDGQPQSGMGQEPNLSFTVDPHQIHVIAFDENSQVSFSRDCERNQLGGNLPDCTWGEVDFGDLRNGGWSGYDCSSIPNSKGNVDYCRMSCEGAKTSSSDSGNMFTDAAQESAGGSLAPGPAAFYAEL